MELSKHKDIIGIDFSADQLSIGLMKTLNKEKTIINLAQYSIAGVSEAEIAQMIIKAFKDFNIKNPYVVNVVPLHLTITKNLEIPSLDVKEIKEIIDLQSGRQTPYAREEIIVDYINIGTYRQSYTKILLVIVTRAAIKKQFDVMEKAGLKIEKIVFAPEGVSRACYSQIKKEVKDSPVVIVHIDSDFTDFIVSLKGVPIFTRNIPIGVKHISADPDKSEIKFIEELKNSLETYQSEDIDKTPQLLILTGATEKIEQLEKLVIGEIHIPIQSMPYFGLIPLSADLAKIPTITKKISFFNIAASALFEKNMKVSLIPEEIKLKRSFEERAQELIKMGIYIICLMLIAGSFFVTELYFKGQYLKNLKKKNSITYEEAKILEKAMEKMRIVKHYMANRGYSLEVVAAIYDILPKEIMLTNIKMDTEKKLHLKGTARAMSNVFTFVSALEASEYFSNVKTNYTTSRKKDDEDWADFGISCVLAK
ncbi:MAG: pilus assembly protein PilM [Candidatus Omnitrophica bacterium]|nr:pilus assembly protein PilM [Candidatus Omnitrophota bacterium]